MSKITFSKEALEDLLQIHSHGLKITDINVDSNGLVEIEVSGHTAPRLSVQYSLDYTKVGMSSTIIGQIPTSNTTTPKYKSWIDPMIPTK